MMNFDLFDFIKKPSFDKKYPLLSKFFTDPIIRQNMMDNADLYRKYMKYENSIQTFIFELTKRFDEETISKILMESVIKLPDEMLQSLMITYLNSDEVAKSNPEFVTYYHKTSNQGIDSINYIEKNGLVTNRTFKDIPDIAIDDKYNNLKTGLEEFNGELLSDVYNTLSYKGKKLVISLIECNSFDMLDQIFEIPDISLKTIITLLLSKGINADILNKELLNSVGMPETKILFYQIIEAENHLNIVNNLIKLIKLKKYNLIKEIIRMNFIMALGSITINEEFVNDLEVMSLLKEKGIKLEKVA